MYPVHNVQLKMIVHLDKSVMRAVVNLGVLIVIVARMNNVVLIDYAKSSQMDVHQTETV